MIRGGGREGRERGRREGGKEGGGERKRTVINFSVLEDVYLTLIP